MLDEDLADLYGVETKRLVEQVKWSAGKLDKRVRQPIAVGPFPVAIAISPDG